MPIGNLGFGNDAMVHYQAGRNLAGPNPLGIMIQGVLNHLTTIQGLQLQQQMDVSGEVQKAKALLPFEIQKIQSGATAKAQAEVDVQKQLFKELGGMPSGGSSGGFVPTKFQVGNMTLENPQQAALIAGNQAYTQEVERRRAEIKDAAELGLNKIATIRQMLQTDGQRIGNRSALSYSIIPGGFLKEAGQRNLRTELGVAHNMLALKRTGKQGLEQQLPYIQEQYNLGETDPDETILFRLNEMEKEFRSALTGGSEDSDFAILGVSP